MKKKIAMFLAAALLGGSLTLTVGGADEWKDTGVDYRDSLETFDYNPGRGQASYSWVVCKDDGTTGNGVDLDAKFSQSGMYSPMFQLSNFSSGYIWTDGANSPNLETHPNKVGGENKPLNDQTLDFIDETFAAAKANGVVCIPRFAYDEEGIIGRDPDDIKWMVKHIEQISKVLNRYKGTVISVECGMVGAFGEMWGSKHAEQEPMNIIIGAWLDNLDESIMLQVRAPSYLIRYIDPEDYYFGMSKQLPFSVGSKGYRIGFYNDGYLGTSNDYGTFGGDDPRPYKNMGRTVAVEFMKEQNKHIPYGGEFAYVDDDAFLKANNSPIYSYGLVKEFYDTHLNYLHNLASDYPRIPAYLKEIEFTRKYDFEGMPDVSDYYGETVSKFLVDHIGYRYVVRSSQTTKNADAGGFVKFKGTVENVGFGNCLFDTVSELVVIGPDGEIHTGDAYVDVKTWESAKTSDYAITMSVPADAKPGEYKVYLRTGLTSYEEAKTPATGTIRFANKDIYNEEVGGNYLGTITVSSSKGGLATEFSQINTGKFKDVPAKEWYADAIDYAVCCKLMSGVSGATFEPEKTTTRAMLVQVLYNLEGRPAITEKAKFTDLKEKWYQEAVHWAALNGIVAGYSETEFAPDKPIKREEFAAILYRYATYKKMDITKRADLSQYEDFGKTSSYAVPALSWANANRYITGHSSVSIDPAGNAERAQMASILMRFTKDTANASK
ncbi:MAG: DUF4832 domain-containing protein [Clostridiales bacterium]|nr:DUF4832 domain-containing protein [Clostridiales bacterium]